MLQSPCVGATLHRCPCARAQVCACAPAVKNDPPPNTIQKPKRSLGSRRAEGQVAAGVAPSPEALSAPGGCQSSCCGCCQLQLCFPFSSDCFHPSPGWGRTCRRHIELSSASFTRLLHLPRIVAAVWKPPPGLAGPHALQGTPSLWGLFPVPNPQVDCSTPMPIPGSLGAPRAFGVFFLCPAPRGGMTVGCPYPAASCTATLASAGTGGGCPGPLAPPQKGLSWGAAALPRAAALAVS